MKHIKKHWLSILFAIISVVWIALSFSGLAFWCQNMAVRAAIILCGILLFVLVELNDSKGMLLLKFDRSISESPLSQCWAAILLFLLCFDVLLAVQPHSPSQIFSDMVSPITLRNDAYPPAKDTLTLTSSGMLVEDSVQVEVPVVSSAPTDRAQSHTILPAIIYMLGLVIFSGVLVATLNRMFATRADRYRNGLTHYRYKNHIVVIGAGDTAISLVKELLSAKFKGHIVVMTHDDVLEFRKRLFSAVDETFHKNLIVQYGDQTSSDDLSHLRVDRMRQIFILGEEPYKGSATRDADNITTMELIVPMRPSYLSPIKCYVRFDHDATLTAFRFSEFSNKIAPVFHCIPFNLHQMMAQKVLVYKTLDTKNNPIQPLEGEGIGYQSERNVHLVIVGMSHMGCTMAIEAARLCHYPNFLRDSNNRTRITFIDPQADTQMHTFMNHYRELFSVSPWRYFAADKDATDYYGKKDCESIPWHTMSEELYDTQLLGHALVDVEWEFVKGNVDDAAVQAYLRNRSLNKQTVLTVAICWDESHHNIDDALYLPAEVYEHGLQVLVYQSGNESVVKMLNDTKSLAKWSERYKKLYSFGLIKEGMDLSQYEFPLAIAANYIYSSMWDEDGALKDTDYRPNAVEADLGVMLRQWNKDLQNGKTQASNRWSNICAAQSIWIKLRNIGWKEGRELTPEEEELLAMVEHYRWNMEQLIAGFRPVQRGDTPEYAVKRNGIHPCLKEYELLTDDYKRIDLFFTRALPYLYDLWKNSSILQKLE